jgi:hypothetical protein
MIGMAVCLLSGCADKSEIPFDPATAGDIKTIGIITPGLPDSADVILASSIGQSFGLVGALVDASIKANRDSRFNALLKAQGLDPNAAFMAHVKAALEARGYTVVMIDVKRDSQSGFVQALPKSAEPTVDAYLDLAVPRYGYLAAGIGSSNPYRPFCEVLAKLVRANNHAVLMQDHIIYNPLNNPEHVVTISPDPQYAFDDVATMEKAPALASSGLRSAIDLSVESMAALIR